MLKKLFLLVFGLLLFANTYANNLQVFYIPNVNDAIYESILVEKNWKSFPDSNLNLGFNQAKVWVKLELNNFSTNEDRILTIDNAHLDYIDFYAVDEHHHLLKKVLTGDRRKYNTRDLNTTSFSFYIPKNCRYIFLNVTTEGQMGLPMSLKNMDTFFDSEYINNAFFWSFFGIVFLSICANIMFYYSVKDITYIYNLLYSISILLFMSIDSEIHFRFFFPNLPDLNHYNIVFYMVGFYPLFFTQKFLNIKENAPKLNIFFYCGYIMIMTILIVNIFISYNIAINLFTYVFYYIILVILGANYYFFVVKKSKPVRFYFVAWNTYLVFAVLYMFVVIDLIPFNLITKNFLLVGASFEIIFVFISVMDKINFLENEKEEARKDIISILEEQAAYIIKENELLEEKISKRTQLLEEKNHKIEHQNEALVAQNNEIENQRKLIEKQHTQLGEYALNLESLIEERTLHLSQANIQLANKNDFLEQFAYITAHNLRAPVASILGLLNLAKIDSNSQVHLNDILSRLLASTSKLNALIKDLAIFLNNAQHSVLHFEDIPIEETINNIIHLLNIDINDANATIHYNQKTISTHIHSVNTYITSIFYNLIINSLKYRDHNKPLIINIVIEENSKEFKFIIEDNGLGFDFQNTDELFQFKNNITNPSLSNLGLGLYIVKKQIDALNGTVKVASKPNEGCKFEITIPKI